MSGARTALRLSGTEPPFMPPFRAAQKAVVPPVRFPAEIILSPAFSSGGVQPHSFFGHRSISVSFSLSPRLCLMNLAGSAILSFGLYQIHSLSGVTEGGILGATLLLQHWFHISPAWSGLIMNALCYLLGWKLMGRDFVLYSLVAGGGFSLFYALFERFPHLWPHLAAMPLTAAVLGALFVGVGVGLCVRAGGAPGGDDALAMSISHLTGWNIRWPYLMSDLIVLALSLTYIPLERIGYSLLTVILSGQIIGFMQRLPVPRADAA